MKIGTLIVSTIALAFVAGSPAEAAKTSKDKKSSTATHTTKHRKVVAATTSRSGYWGTDAVPRGPIYNGLDYLGDDPDPNVRAFIIKDLSGHYGGSF